MQRTPPWVWVAAVAVNVAALGLCVWAMERSTRVVAEIEPGGDVPERRPALPPPPAPPQPAPRFGPPPRRVQPAAEDFSAPLFIAELADASTQILYGRTADGTVIFGCYPDGNMRCVDADGGRYSGKAESARARMREHDGTRAFTVQVGIARDGRLQATFTGGAHDGETIALDPLAEDSAA